MPVDPRSEFESRSRFRPRTPRSYDRFEKQLPEREHFRIGRTIPIEIDVDLAVSVGEFITEKGSNDKRIMAFGFQLRNLVKFDSGDFDDEEETQD